MAAKASTQPVAVSTEEALNRLAGIDVRLRAYLAVAIPPSEERIDVQREALCEAWICLTTDGESAETEALRVARRACARWKRQLRAELSEEGTRAVTDPVAPSEATQRYRHALWEYEDRVLLPNLTGEQRAALEMHVMDDLSDSEIAKIAGLRQGALRALRHTAKGRLRQLVREGRIPPPPTADE